MSLKETLFKSKNSKTFENEESLPALPVPSLRSTLDCYLDSVRAVVDDIQYSKTEELCKQFESGVGQTLHELLQSYAKSRKNWLTNWWLDYAYLMSRSPLIPSSNMTGVQPNFDFWPLRSGTRAERTALISQFNLEFWQLLRKEQLKATKVRGTLWSMDQFRYLFNTCRIPGEEKDYLINDFKTESEGPPGSTMTIVLYRGYIFAFDNLIDEQLLNASEIESQLSYIEKWCQSQSQDGPGVGTLTTTGRTEWAVNRNHLKSLSPENDKYLDIIEKAMAVCAFEDKEPQNPREIGYEAMCGNCVDRWADKSITNIAFNNGNFAAMCDHTPFDALALAILSQYINLSIFESKGQYCGPKHNRTLSVPTLLDFKIDDQLRQEIEIGKQIYRESCDKVEFLHEVFRDYGRSVSAKHKIHPEAYVQIAIQLAYYRMHGKPAPTYCTATTRRFYKGRTETCRSCTPESIEFAKAMVAGNRTNIELYNLLVKAGQKFQQIMANACRGQGCDRHFLGLYIMSVENDIEMPEIFTDPSFMDSGGNGTYVLSTSCAGYWKACGGVPPMREDGYSCFYGIEDHQYSFSIFSFKTCAETSAQLFYKNLCQSLNEMQKILDSNKTDSTQLQHNI